MTKKVEKKVPNLRFKGFTDDWEQRKLGDIVTFFSGLTYHPNDVTNSGCFVIRSSNIQNHQIVSADDVFVDKNIVNAINVVQGDIVVVVRNGSRNLIGKHAQVITDMPNTVIGAFMTGLRSKNSSYINALLDSDQFQKEIRKNLGATINQITIGEFKKMRFMVTNNSESHMIGKIFTQINNLISLQQRKLELLKRLKKGFLQKMFVDTTSKTPIIRFKEFTDEWKHNKLGTLFTERNEKSNKGQLLSISIMNGVHPFNTNERKNNSSKNKSHYKRVCINDIAYNSMRMWQGAEGVSSYQGIVSPAYTVLRPKNNIDSQFFGFMFKRTQMLHTFQSHSQGLTSDTWNLKYPLIKSIIVHSPMYMEQCKISNILTKTDNYISLQQRKINILNRLKSFLLQQMFI